jgi:hypothetical protein
MSGGHREPRRGAPPDARGGRVDPPPRGAAVGSPGHAGTLGVAALVASSIVVVALHGSFGRPIWIDEFVHFALGSHVSTSEAARTIYETTVGLSHGQTGVYMLLDYWLMQLFGASATALRAPSLVSALLLLWGAVALLRWRGFGLVWQVLVVLAVAGHGSLMHFAGEARPYMPLAAATVGTAAYYLAPAARRGFAPVEALGVTSIVWGALFHPYFALYWLAVFAFAHAVAIAEDDRSLGLRSLLTHVNLPLSAGGAATYFTVGALTWLRGGPEFTGMDPFHYVKREALLAEFIDHTHLNFLQRGHRVAFLVLLCAVPLVVAILPRRWRAAARPVAVPGVLFVLALALAVLMGWLSYRRNYWILGRQFVASMALVVVAFVWFWAELARAARPASRVLSAVALAVAVFVVGRPASRVLARNADALVRHVRASPSPTGEPGPPGDAPPPADNDGWVELANRNIRAGGPVWPVFRKYYGK